MARTTSPFDNLIELTNEAELEAIIDNSIQGVPPRMLITCGDRAATVWISSANPQPFYIVDKEGDIHIIRADTVLASRLSEIMRDYSFVSTCNLVIKRFIDEAIDLKTQSGRVEARQILREHFVHIDG